MSLDHSSQGPPKQIPGLALHRAVVAIKAQIFLELDQGAKVTRIYDLVSTGTPAECSGKPSEVQVVPWRRASQVGVLRFLNLFLAASKLADNRTAVFEELTDLGCDNRLH